MTSNIPDRYQVAITPPDEPRATYRCETEARKSEAFALARRFAALPESAIGAPFAVHVYDTMPKPGARAHWEIPRNYTPPENCGECGSRVAGKRKQRTDWYGTLHRGSCRCGRVVDQGSGWEPSAH